MSLHRLTPILSLGLLVATAMVAAAQTPTSPETFGAAREIPLYSSVAPGSEKWDYAERAIQGKSGPQLNNVVRPTLLYFPAQRPIGTAMIVAPGGGNRTLMMSYEGIDIAKKLNEVGIDAFVLKYRLIYTGPNADNADPPKSGPQAGQNVRELSAADGRRAMEVVRMQAEELKIRPNRVGMIGFSAGGGPIRAAMEGPAATRPDFVALIYAANSRDATAAVPEGAPPLFLAVASDDRIYQGSINTFLAWRAANVPVELHIFQMGAHGFVNKGGGADHFMDRVAEWMKVNGWLSQN